MTLTPAGTLLIANDIAKDDPEFSKKVLVRYNAPVVRRRSLYFTVAVVYMYI